MRVHNGKAHRPEPEPGTEPEPEPETEPEPERLLHLCSRCDGEFYYNDDQRVIVCDHCGKTTYWH